MSPTKLFDVFYRPQQESSLNSHDPAEIGVFIQGVEEELKDKGLPLVELNMLTEAREQIEGDEKFWELVKEEIVSRGYHEK